MAVWTCKEFDELNVYELYAILQLRNEVFVVEQQCIFQDADNKDQLALHLMGWNEGLLTAYTRLLYPGHIYKEASIGRVITSSKFRRSGFGRQLMQQSIDQIYARWGIQPIRIGAQLYLKKFYESLGFQQDSGLYLEDGIEHIEMLLPNNL